MENGAAEQVPEVYRLRESSSAEFYRCSSDGGRDVACRLSGPNTMKASKVFILISEKTVAPPGEP